MRVVTYSRVSTDHHGQKPEAQAEFLREYCKARQWSVDREIIDQGYSGSSAQRPGLADLIKLVRSREVDVVIVTKLDRLFRSLKHLISFLDELQSLGVQFVAVRDSIDYTTPSGRLFTQILASLAEFERELIRERTMAGLDFARRKGKKLGRPVKHDSDKIIQLRQQGMSYRNIAKELHVPMGSVIHALKHG